jgi:hypothetical protein
MIESMRACAREAVGWAHRVSGASGVDELDARGACVVDRLA